VPGRSYFCPVTLSDKYRPLIRTALITIGIALLLMGLNMLLFPNDLPRRPEMQGRLRGRFIPVAGITICWIWNIIWVAYGEPRLGKWTRLRWLSLYLPSYVGMCLLEGILLIGAPPIRVFMSSLLIDTLVLVIMELTLSRLEAARIRLENAELKVANLRAQHEKLKHQLQPHFLFNSLNALKTLIKRDPNQAERYLVKLAEFLRFSLRHTEQQFVSLEEELRFSTTYLEMQKTRFRESLLYTIEVPLEVPSRAMIPAFSLQLLVENAIKHNVLTVEEPLHIVVRYVEGKGLIVENNLQARAAEPGTGLGLKNLSQRYRLLTQEDIEVVREGHTFRVCLPVIPLPA
jgi:two-component system LytT family sensor kinase